MKNIERLVIEHFVAEQKRINAKKLRHDMRLEHLCVHEGEPKKCYQLEYREDGLFYPLPLEYWCENCKIMQPYHWDYIKKARIANALKGRLTNALKKYSTEKIK